MNPLTLLIIYFTAFSGPMVPILSTNPILMWIGLKMSLLAITPLLINKKIYHQSKQKQNILLLKQQDL